MEHEEIKGQSRRSAGNPVPWFWLGAGIGLLLATGATVVAAELTRRRYLRDRGEPVGDDIEIVDDLANAIHAGLDILTGVADHLTGRHSYNEGNRERIRYGLDPGQAGAGSSGWYTGEDDEDL
ncbi:hypothetical protein JW859_14875 [bacterium]|nr:hypothetical protein [bacterium]